MAPVGVSIKPERGGFPRESASLIEKSARSLRSIPRGLSTERQRASERQQPPSSPISVTLQKRPPSIARHLRVARRHLRALAWNDNAQGSGPRIGAKDEPPPGISVGEGLRRTSPRQTLPPPRCGNAPFPLGWGWESQIDQRHFPSHTALQVHPASDKLQSTFPNLSTSRRGSLVSNTPLASPPSC